MDDGTRRQIKSYASTTLANRKPPEARPATETPEAKRDAARPAETPEGPRTPRPPLILEEHERARSGHPGDAFIRAAAE
jgi:hypothetical protein